MASPATSQFLFTTRQFLSLTVCVSSKGARSCVIENETVFPSRCAVVPMHVFC